MRKSVFTLFAALLFTAFVQAQTAMDWLNKISKTYESVPTYYIKFELKDSGSDTSETGELFAAREKYSVNIMDIRQMYDGKTLYTISKDDKEVTVSNPDKNSDDFLTPTRVLRMYKTGFGAELGKKGNEKGKNLQYVKLTPEKSSEVKYIEVAIDTDSNSLYSYKELLSDGNSRTITVKEYMENLIIPGTLFKFDKDKYTKDGYVVTQL